MIRNSFFAYRQFLCLIDHIFFRDKLSSDDCIGTYYLPMSEISGQGEEGWCTVDVNSLFYMHVLVREKFPSFSATQRFIRSYV